MTTRARPKQLLRGTTAKESATESTRPSRKEKGKTSFASLKSRPVIVGIGASAGGLQSLSAMLKQLPVDTGMSFVIVQHMDARQVSRLPMILGRDSKMPVLEAEQGTSPAPNHVYVLPPGKDIALEDGVIKLTGRETRGGSDGQVDFFFSSLAKASQENAIAVVLSGTGTDGTQGLREIKEQGGITFAEARTSAGFFGMPGSAISSGVVDETLTPAGIARRLTRISRHPEFGIAKEKSGRAEKKAEALPSLDPVFAVMKSLKRVNFTDYKHNTLRRRIARRMMLRRIDNLGQYCNVLRKDSKEVDNLFKDLLISVTGFFRDNAVFQALSKNILPKVINDKKESGTLRVWVPGCATGEEAYSIAICLCEACGQHATTLSVQIFGTDLSEWAIAKARTGVYSSATVNGISSERLRRFFVRKGEGYQVDRSIRDMCTFAQQDVCEDPPFSRLDLISCRNVLIYFDSKLQRKCLPLFYYALNPRGYLLLGNSESIGGFADLFSLVDKKGRIYQKKTTPFGLHQPGKAPQFGAASRMTELALTTPTGTVKAGPRSARQRRELEPDIQMATDRLILTHFAPCGVVIDAHFQVWHFRGNTAPFLEHTPGAASLNILKLVRHGLAADISTAAHQAIKSGIGVRKEGLIVQTVEGPREIQLEVVPFKTARSADQWLLVVFESRLPATPVVLEGKTLKAHVKSSYLRENSRLRTELASTKQSLQTIIEDQEAANEEIKSANEEIESSNEELQSTNEELETAREELQSTNEELTTVNDELNNRNQEANELNTDLNSLLTSLHLAIVVVDNALTIRRSTPLADRLFNLIPTDIGRKLTDLNPNLEVPDLPDLIRSVLEQLAPREQLVKDHAGNVYSMRVRLFRTSDNVIKGAVITLIDMAEIRNVEPASSATRSLVGDDGIGENSQDGTSKPDIQI